MVQAHLHRPPIEMKRVENFRLHIHCLTRYKQHLMVVFVVFVKKHVQHGLVGQVSGLPRHELLRHGHVWWAVHRAVHHHRPRQRGGQLDGSADRSQHRLHLHAMLPVHPQVVDVAEAVPGGSEQIRKVHEAVVNHHVPLDVQVAQVSAPGLGVGHGALHSRVHWGAEERAVLAVNELVAVGGDVPPHGRRKHALMQSVQGDARRHRQAAEHRGVDVQQHHLQLEAVREEALRVLRPPPDGVQLALHQHVHKLLLRRAEDAKAAVGPVQRVPVPEGPAVRLGLHAPQPAQRGVGVRHTPEVEIPRFGVALRGECVWVLLEKHRVDSGLVVPRVHH
mmetsp:Transcript_10606/g.20046  ORF Transcript_10606/g.20046 Transcript_10606/m.20046 type:complete len:334 (-) Transcript_10606:120-1121(-)